MYILNVDIATRKTGMLIIDTDTDKICEKWTLKVSEKVTGHAHLSQVMYQRMLKQFEAWKQKYNIEQLVIEDVLQGRAFLTSALSIHASRTACVLAYLHTYNNSHGSVYYYSPQKAKHHVAKKRGANKEEMRVALEKNHRKFLVDHDLNEDEMDALALYLLHQSKEGHQWEKS